MQAKMLIKKISKIFLAMSLVLVFCSILTKAQVYVPPNMFSNPVLQLAMENRNMTTTAISGLIRSQMLRNGSKGAKSAQARQPVSVGPTSFTASSANSIVKSLVSQMGGSVAEQKQAEDFFNLCLETYWDTARKDGFPINDLAYGFEHYIVNSYHVYYHVFEKALNYDSPSDFTKHPRYVQMYSEKAIYQQFRGLLGGSSEIKKLSNKEKQQYTEMLVIMANTAFKLYEAGLKNRDDKLIEQAQKMAKENLENLFQSPVEEIVINKDGISLNK